MLRLMIHWLLYDTVFGAIRMNDFGFNKVLIAESRFDGSRAITETKKNCPQLMNCIQECKAGHCALLL